MSYLGRAIFGRSSAQIPRIEAAELVTTRRLSQTGQRVKCEHFVGRRGLYSRWWDLSVERGGSRNSGGFKFKIT